MKLNSSANTHGFTLAEIMIAMAASAVVFGGTMTSTTALQKSFNAIDNYFATGQPLDPALSELMNISPDAGRTAAATVIARRRAELRYVLTRGQGRRSASRS